MCEEHWQAFALPAEHQVLLWLVVLGHSHSTP